MGRVLLGLALSLGCGGSNPEWESPQDAGDADTDSDSDSASTSDTASDSESDSDTPSDTGSDDSRSEGCGKGGATGLRDESLDVAGVTRTYLFSVPEGYDADVALPLIFGWHGAGGRGEDSRNHIRVEQASAGAAIFVYPDALPLPGFAAGWELDEAGRDVALFDALLELVSSDYCVDLGRVFSYGFSFGGYFSNSLGCFRADRLLAIAPIAGGGPPGGCEGTVSVWIAHNQDDDVVAFAEGETARDHWLVSNACGAESAPVDPAPCVEYGGCEEGRRVVFCAPETGGHGSHGYAGAAVWNFFTVR